MAESIEVKSLPLDLGALLLLRRAGILREDQALEEASAGDREKAMAWYNSPAYREAMQLREASSTSNLFMIEGVDWVVPGT